MIQSIRRLAGVTSLLFIVLGALSVEGAAHAAHAELAHPYLFFRAGELPAIRRRFADPPQSYYLEALLDNANAKDEKAKPHRHLWAYLLTGEKQYREQCLKWVKEESGRADFSAEWMGFKICYMAMAYDALYPELDAEVRAEMKGYLERALAAHRGKMDSWYYNNPSNTVAAQGGAAGMAALALRWESPKAAEAIVQTRRKLKTYAAQCFAEDGGYIEGTLYWNFGVQFYLLFAHADRNTTGNDDLLNNANLKKQHRFAETMLGGDGQFMTFNDTQPWLTAWPVCADLGRRFDQDLPLWLADHMAALASGERENRRLTVDRDNANAMLSVLMLTQGDPGPKREADRPFPGVPTVSVLNRQQWGVMRNQGDAYIPEFVVGVKGSEGPLSHHRQKDLGSFVLYAEGEMLLLDPGYFNADPADHTLPLINGKGPGHHGSRIVEAWARGPWRVMVIDSTTGYGRLADRARRILVMHGDQALVVVDDIVPGDGVLRDDNVMGRWSPPEIGVDPDAIKATAQYQAARRAHVDPETGAAFVEGRRVTLGLWTFGPTLELAARKRDFGKSWIFRKRAAAGLHDWHSLTGQYTLEPDKPLVTVLMPAAAEGRLEAPDFQREGRTMTIKLPDDTEVRFVRVDGRWKLDHPSSPPQKPRGDESSRE